MLLQKIWCRYVAGVLAVFLAAQAASAATLLHRYSFSETSGSTTADGVGGIGWNGFLLGGTTFSSGAVSLNGSGAYVDLPNSIVATSSSVSFEIWLTDNGSGTWARIFDFGFSTAGEGAGGTGTNYIFLTPQSGSGTLRAGIRVNNLGAEQIVEWAGTRLPIGVEKHVVLTIDATTKTGRLFVDGAMVGETTGVTFSPALLGNTFNNWMGRSQFSGDAYLNGSIAEFRIYDGALTATEVQQDFVAGPEVALLSGPVAFLAQPQSQTVGELMAGSFHTSFSGTPPIGVQWRRNGVNITGATNSTYTFTAALSDHNAAYSVVVTNSHLGSPYAVTSSNAILTVTADNSAPLLVRADSLFPDEVRVVFSEGVSDATGTNMGNYLITRSGGSLAVTGARFGASPAEIILSTGSQTVGTNYTVTVSNVRDRAAAANLIAANSQTTFIASQFVAVDIGNPAIGGIQVSAGGGIDLSAAGVGIGGASDQFTFSYQDFTNNFDVRVRVARVSLGGPWTRAALMAREGLATNAAFAASVASPGTLGCHFEARAAIGASATMSGTFPVNYPDTWLRLRRVGGVLDGFASLDGITWEFLGSASISMANVVQVGLALTAATPGASVTAQFRDFGNAGGIITTNAPLPFEPPGPSSRRTGLVISEIMYHPRNSWEGTNSLEFIELWNSGLTTEDLTGHKLSGEIDYEFPAGTKIAPGQFLVIAKEPAAAQNFYGGTFLGPYAGKLANNGGTLRLRNELGGILLEINYDAKAPWPVAADGTGHSLVLQRPSYGENDPRAWAASDGLAGSPGAFEPYGNEPARGIVINEFLAHTDAPQVDYIELYNPDSQPVNLSGAWLSDEAGTNKFQLANGTTIPSRGFLAFTQAQLGFALSADGEAIYLVNSNQTRVLDAVKFDGQENGVSMGRYPNGAPTFQILATVTQGTSNTPPRLPPVVLNEIMYHPISEEDNDEYVELYNRSGATLNLSNWKLQGGVSFTFPSNTMLAANSYLVVAENVTNLLAKYAHLNATNTVGNYNGVLGNNGERIELARPDDLVTTNGATLVTNIFYITVDEVNYGDGGRWGQWSDGGGSSLELIDPDADNRLPTGWADSNESAKGGWTTIDLTDVMENGQTPLVNEGSASYGAANRLEFFLQGEGEALVDELEFRSNGGANLVSNGAFNTGTNGWTLGGVLRGSFVENGVGVGGSTALHLVATGRGDTGANKIACALTATAATTAPNTGTIRAQARWLKGNPFILLRSRGNWLEVSQRLNVPGNLGTPGLPNSRLVANAGPAITEVAHLPVLPAVNQTVLVSARVADPDGVGVVQLKYRVDPGTTYTTVTMTNDFGIYRGAIPGQAANTLVAFSVSATDGLGAGSQFPEVAPARECHVRWGESSIAGSIGTYRLWLTAANIGFWTTRERNANDPLDATFVYGNYRAIYNVAALYSGSPFHTPAYNGPLAAIACDYEVNFRKDERFLGTEPFVLSAYDVADGNFFFNDDSAQVDLTGNWIARKLGQQYNYRRHVNVVVNGVKRGTIYDDAQQPNSDMLAEYFPDTTAELRKIESWFEFADNAQDQGSVYATLTRATRSSGGIDAKRYRWNWRPRATDNPDDWWSFTNLIAAVNGAAAPNYVERVRTWLDVPNFLRPIVAHHICGSWDSYAYSRGKNMFAARPDGEGWRLLMWDIEISLGAGGDGATTSIYTMFDTVLRDLILNNPVIHREYLRAFQEAVNTSLVAGAADVALDERYAAFQQHGLALVSPQFIKNYIASRRAYLLGVLPDASFAISNAGYQVVSGSNVITLQGTGPLAVEKILVNANACPVNWTSVTNWSVTVPLNGGTNLLTVAAEDRKGNPLTNASGSVTVNYTGGTVAPEGFVVFNEILAQPAPGQSEFVELFNTHSNYTFALGGWRINGLDYTFPPGTILPPRSYLVVARDAQAFNQTYGGTNVASGEYAGALDNQGETLTLFRPGAGTNEIVVDRLRYEATAPWPAATNGVSLQLQDANQDNSRVANWTTRLPATNIVVSSPQWVYVTETGTLPASATRLYLYLGSAGEIYVDDMMLVAGSVPESGANLLNNGNFESALAGSWTVSSDFAGSSLSTTVKHAGNSSLRMVAAAAGAGNNDSIQQNFAATLPTGGTYTLSFWYLQNTAGTPLVARLSGSTVSTGVYASFDPRVAPGSTNFIPGATPGALNSVATNLPAFPPLWLNELQASNLTGPLDNFGQRDPWAEVINLAGTNVSLSGYYLTDSYTNLTRWPFPGGAIASNGFTLVWCDNAPAQGTTSSLHAGLALAGGSGSLALTRSINGVTQVVDYLNYAALPANWSFGAVPDAQPFYRAAMFYATPSAANNGAAAPLAVVINEWLADNIGALADPADGNYEDWFELYNPGAAPADLGGYYLTDNLTNKFQFQIPNNGQYVIPAGGYLLVWADNEANQNTTNRPDLHVAFALAKGGEALGLFAPDGTMIDSVTFGTQNSNVSEGRFPNGAVDIFLMPTPTPRVANVVPNTAPSLAPLSNRVVTVGQTLTFSALGTDFDTPAQTLAYSLGPAAGGAAIGLFDGVFSWTPTVAPATNLFAVMVTDSGNPSLTATQTFAVVTAPLPVPMGTLVNGSEFLLSWGTVAGQRFQVEYTDDLGSNNWVATSAILIGTGLPLSFTDDFEEVPQRYFRLRVLPP